MIKGNKIIRNLYNGLGSNKRFSVSVPNTFETMRMNEFVANKFVALFYLHDFGHLLFKTEKFQPTFAIKLNAGFGTLNNVNQHLGISTKSYEKGFYETGLLLNNLLRSGFSSLGIGAFYRLGPYANVTPKDNLAVKLSLGIAF